MRAWLYQMSAHEWPPERYREEVWEGQPTRWPTGRIAGDDRPAEGDMFFAWYAKTGCDDPGLYGWGIVIRSVNEFDQLHWMPVFPSDYLKMHPLFDEEIDRLVSSIRRPVAQARCGRSQTRGSVSSAGGSGITCEIAHVSLGI